MGAHAPSTLTNTLVLVIFSFFQPILVPLLYPLSVLLHPFTASGTCTLVLVFGSVSFLSVRLNFSTCATWHVNRRHSPSIALPPRPCRPDLDAAASSAISRSVATTACHDPWTAAPELVFREVHPALGHMSAKPPSPLSWPPMTVAAPCQATKSPVHVSFAPSPSNARACDVMGSGRDGRAVESPAQRYQFYPRLRGTREELGTGD